MITSIGQALSGTITNKITDVASIILITTQDSSVVNLVSGSLPQAGGFGKPGSGQLSLEWHAAQFGLRSISWAGSPGGRRAA